MSISNILVPNEYQLFGKSITVDSLINNGLTTTDDLNVTNDANIGDSLSVGGQVNLGGDINSTANASFLDVTCQNANVSNQLTIGSALRYSAGPVVAGNVLTAQNVSGDATWQAPAPAPERQVVITPFVVDASQTYADTYEFLQDALDDIALGFNDNSQVIYVINRAPLNENIIIPDTVACAVVGVSAPGSSVGAVFQGSITATNNCKVTFQNMTISNPSGLQSICTVGDLVNVPQLSFLDCYISDSGSGFPIFSVGSQATLNVENCIVQSIGAPVIQTNTTSDNSFITLRNNPFLFSSSDGVVELVAVGSICALTIDNCPQVLSVNDITIRSSGLVSMLITKSSILCNSFECVYVDTTSSLISSYNSYSSSAVSTFTITGGALAPVTYFADYGNSNTTIDPALTVTPFTANT